MTLTSITNKVTYNGDGATTEFAVPFVFWDDDDVRVIQKVTATGVETVWTRGAEFTLSGGSGSTGTLTATTAPASGTTLTIKSDLDDVQNTSLPAGGPFPSASVEQRFDQITRLIQQHSEEIARLIGFGETSTSTATIPEPEDGKVLGWDSTDLANLTPNTQAFLSVSAYILTLLNDADAATARATLGLVIGTDVNAQMATVSQADAEAGTATDRRAWTAERVKQAIVALETVVAAASQAEMEAASITTKYASPGTVNYHPGVAKAWVHFNGTGTVAIDADHGVSSITDNGVGNYTITWDTPFSTDNYGVASMSSSSGTNENQGGAGIESKAAGSLTIETGDGDAAPADVDDVNVVAFGDQ